MSRYELYGTSTCPYIRDVREWLEDRRADITEFDIEAAEAARERMRALAAGQRTVPVLVEAGRVVQVGWQGRSCVVEP